MTRSQLKYTDLIYSLILIDAFDQSKLIRYFINYNN